MQNFRSLRHGRPSTSNSIACLGGRAAGFNAGPRYHHHLGTSSLGGSTLSDADCPPGTSVETLAALSAIAGRQLRCEGMEMVRRIDASPIQTANRPNCAEMTAVNVNDIEISRQVPPA